MKREALFTALATVLVVAFLGGALELWVRTAVDDGMQYDLEMWKYARQLKRISSNPNIGHEHRPSSQAHLMGADVSINDKGLRDKPLSFERIANERRVLMLGDSLTFGWGVKDEDLFSNLIEEQFRRDGKPVDVINTGVGNYNTSMEVEYFFSEGYKYKPDVIALNYFINDAEPTPKYTGNFLSENFQSWVYLSGRFDILMRQVSKRKDWSDYYHGLYRDDASGWRQTQSSIEKLAAYCRENGIKLVIFHLPELRQLSPYPFTEESNKLAQVAAKNSVPFVDLLESVKDHDPSTLWVTVPDPHPNGKANRLLAPAMHKILTQLLGD